MNNFSQAIGKISVKWKVIFLIIVVIAGYGYYQVKSISSTLKTGLHEMASRAEADAQKKQGMANVDMKMARNIAIVKDVAEKYRIEYGSYKGFSFDVVRADNFYTSVNEAGCSSRIYLDISPDGKKYIAYYPTCFNEKMSAYCVQNDMEKAILANSSIAQKEYRCEAFQNPDDRFAEVDKKMFANTMVVWDYLERYKKENGSYQGFSSSNINESGFSLKGDAPQCSNEIKTEVFGDGRRYRITYDLCLNDQVLCVESTRYSPTLVPKELLQRTTDSCRS